MHAALKILIGLILIAAGFGLFVDSVYANQWTGIGINWWNNFKVVVTGLIPPFLIIVGLFVVWLEADELKAEKEIGAEEGAQEVQEMKKAVSSKKPGRPKRRK